MPLFFIASGIFISSGIQKKGLYGYINARVQNILFPLIVWGFIQTSMQIYFSAYTNSVITPMDYLYLLIDPRRTAQFWYLNALFCVGVVYAVLKVKFKVKLWQQMIIGLVFYFLLAYIRSRDVYLGFVMDIFQYYIFFAMGDAISKFMLDERGAKFFSSYKLIVPIVLSFIFIQYSFTKINLSQHDNYFVEHNMPLFFMLVALVGCTLSICISFALKRKKLLSFLRVVGYHSVHIYCMQVIVIAISRFIFIKIVHISYPPFLMLLLLCCGIVLPMIIYNLCLRLNMWWLFSLKKPNGDIQSLTKGKMILQND
jgi:fucose 4-O-acetylase-like acetyltransferase